jgi:riboflavin synthase alpha subunit
MFTGIITGVGRIAALHDLGSSLLHGKRLTIEAPPGYLDDTGLGDSIAINGACMTVTSLDLSHHTLHHRHFSGIAGQDRGAGPAGPRQPGKGPARP